MKFNKKQLTHMVLLGLAQNATDEQALAFYNDLTGALQAQVLALAHADEGSASGAASGAASGSAQGAAKASTAAGGADASASAASAAATAEAIGGAVKTALQIERERVQKITALAEDKKLPASWAQNHINRGSTIEDVTAAASEMADLLKDYAPISGVAVGEDRNISTLGPAISDAILGRAGIRTYESDEDGKPKRDSATGKPIEAKRHERAGEFRGMRLVDVCRSYLQAVGINTQGMYAHQMAKLCLDRGKLQRQAGSIFAAHSTSDFDNILADVLGKTLRARYIELAPNWPVWAREASAPDFKSIKRTQLSGFGTPPAVGEGAEYTYATKSDSKEQYTLVKYGQIFKITWEALINDDLDAFTRIPSNHGASCARLEDDVAYNIITANADMADAIDLFHASHSNLLTGTGIAAALSVASLGAAKAKMRLQTGLAGEPLDIAPAVLMVPVALETTARQLISSMVDPAKSNAVPNPFNNDLVVVANPRLDANSAIAWYLLATPLQIDTVEVCFLEGMRMPQLEEEAGFDVDARKYKVRHTVAAKAIDWRGMVKNTGA